MSLIGASKLVAAAVVTWGFKRVLAVIACAYGERVGTAVAVAAMVVIVVAPGPE